MEKLSIFNKANKKKRIKKFSNAQVMALGFLMVILVGTLLLMLPISNRDGDWAEPLTAFFTATSATCVTGLVVVDTYTHWTIFGQLVILTMIQIGGLGFITVSVMFSLLLRRKIGLNIRGLIQDSVSSMQLSGTVRLTRSIVRGTMLIEGIGAVILSIRFIPQMGFAKGAYYGLFHSVSAFCNAGFDLFGYREKYSSLIWYTSDLTVNVTIMVLIIIGGLGFIVWEELKVHRFRFRMYSLHTKIVVSTNLVLIFGGAILFSILERNNLLAGFTVYENAIASLFASVTTRTAGFNTLDLSQLTQGGLLLHVLLMFIGGSPGSTAGGIKTTTIVVVIAYVWSNLRNSSGCNIFQRRISDEDIKKANMVLCLNLGTAFLALLLICATNDVGMEDVLMEVFSAIGTVGLSTGLTREINDFAKIVIMFLMYCGRVGSMTFGLSFAYNNNNARVQYPEEQVNVG